MSMLFSPYQIKDVTLKNRIVMSPMCMFTSKNDGMATEWHKMHYTSRAVGQVGLILTETVAVHSHGRIAAADLGIWDDAHVEGLREIVRSVHNNGSKIGIQLGHAGRKANLDVEVISPSPIPFKDCGVIPKEMSTEDIKSVIENFRVAVQRSKEAEFDVIELHGAHGYLISTFLSPLTNQRTDEYGGSRENRYRFLKELVEAVTSVWKGPLFVRLSVDEYHPEGNTMDDFIYYSDQLRQQGVDLIDCSSGAVVPAEIDVFPGYQVPLADKIKNSVGIATGAVGLITQAVQAEEIIKNNRADLIFIGRELLRDPYWALRAASQLGVMLEVPVQYNRAWNEVLHADNRSIQQRWGPGKESLVPKALQK
jgi:NADPH2 dehydrogenase